VYSFDSLRRPGSRPTRFLLRPGVGKPYNEQDPDGAMRAQPFGPHGEGLAVYLVLEQQRRVVMLSVTWVG